MLLLEGSICLQLCFVGVAVFHMHKLITVRTGRRSDEHATSNHYPLGSALSLEQLKGNRMASSSCCSLIIVASFSFLLLGKQKKVKRIAFLGKDIHGHLLPFFVF